MHCTQHASKQNFVSDVRDVVTYAQAGGCKLLGHNGLTKHIYSSFTVSMNEYRGVYVVASQISCYKVESHVENSSSQAAFNMYV